MSTSSRKVGIKQPNKMSRDRALKLVVFLPNIRKNLSKKGGFLSGNPVGREEVNFPGQIKIDFAQHFSVSNLAASCIWAKTLHSDFSWDILFRCWAKNSKKIFVCLFSQTFAYFGRSSAASGRRVWARQPAHPPGSLSRNQETRYYAMSCCEQKAVGVIPIF